ncbi:MAG: tyrosine-type recombinase/integrase [Methyloceanibacter sp.]
MPQIRFTDAKVRQLRSPKGKAQADYFESLPPGRSLVLTVGAARKTWSCMFYVRGKPKRRKLGYFGHHDAEFPDLSCKQAREAVRSFDVKAALTRVKAGSFKEVAENWFERHASKLRSRSELRRHLDTIILPAWGDLLFSEVRRREVNALLDKIEDQRGPNQADALLATIRALVNWQQSRDEDYISPIVAKMRRGSPVKRDRILTDDEILAIWSAATDCSSSFGAIVKACLLTGQRKAKIAEMKWADVDFDSGVWTIATEPREKGNPGLLKLPQMAIDLIAAQPTLIGNPHVFASASSRKQEHGHFHAWSQRKRQLDRLLPPMPPWTIHDLRRTARSLLSRIGVNRDIAERVMGHAIAGVEEIYDRHRYANEMADALSRLAAEIERILNPSAKIVALRG